MNLLGKVIELLAASGVGAAILAIVQHLLGYRSAFVKQTADTVEIWKKLVDELQSERVDLLKELYDHRAWRTEATKQIGLLEINDTSKSQLISALQVENERLGRQVELLRQENDALSVRLTNLQDRIRVLEEENQELKKENKKLQESLERVRST